MKLLPVRNYRWTNHHCCARCRYWDYIPDDPPNLSYYPKSGYFECRRPDGNEGDWNAIEPEFRVCDLFAHPSSVPESDS